MFTMIPRAAGLMAFAFTAVLSLSACDQEGPAEKVGESIDNSVQQLGEAVETTGKDAQDAAK